MNRLEKQMFASLRVEVEVNPAHMERTILDVQDAYAAQPHRARLKFSHFMLVQMRFAGVRMWIWQGMVLMALLTGLYLMQTGLHRLFLLRHLPFLLGCCGVVTVTAVIPLVYRSIRYRMQETEHACYFSGAQLMFARLLVVGTGVLLTLGAVMGIVIGQHWLGIGCAVLYVCVPSLMTACSYLTLLVHTTREHFPMLGGMMSGLLVLLLYTMSRMKLYPQQFGIGSGVLCIALVFLCAVQMRRLADAQSIAVS